MQLDYLTRSFSASAGATVSRLGNRLAALAGKLDAMSPLRVIARGYAIASCEDAVVTAAGDVHTGDTLLLQFHDGQVACRVEDTIIKDGEAL